MLLSRTGTFWIAFLAAFGSNCGFFCSCKHLFALDSRVSSFPPCLTSSNKFPACTSSQRLQSTILRLVCCFHCFSMIGWLNYHVTFCRNDITCGVTLPQNGRKYPVNPYQLWTMSFCTARRASLRTLGSLWDIIFITLTLQPRFSSTLRIKEHTNSDWKHKSFVENSLR